MNILSIFYLFAIVASGIALQLVADSPAFMDHGDVLVDKPDIPGNIAGPDGSPPTHVTYSDQEEAVTRIIYH